jgi:hypothetical protein
MPARHCSCYAYQLPRSTSAREEAQPPLCCQRSRLSTGGSSPLQVSGSQALHYHTFSVLFFPRRLARGGSVAGLSSPCTACAAARRCARYLKTQRPCTMFCALNSSVSQFAVMNAAAAVLPDVIAGPTINAARLNELCRCPTSIAPPSPLRCTSSLRCSACVELAGAWGGTADIVYSGRCVCTLADMHPTTAEGSCRVACSVSSSGIRCVKQCLEAVLVAFEAAGDTRLICC